MLNIYLDESIEQVDKKLWKISICGVEIGQEQVEDSVARIMSTIADPIRFPKTGRKIHFSEMNDAQQSQIVEVISKLPIGAKTYTYYLMAENEAAAKRTAMERAVNHLQHIHRARDITVFVEHANEYRDSEVKGYLHKDLPAFMLPDAILSVYSKFLNDTKTYSTSSNARFYVLLKAKIRLQSFSTDEHQEHNERDRRL